MITPVPTWVLLLTGAKGPDDERRRRGPHLLRTGGSYVYLAKVPGGHKIGSSRKPWLRMQQLGNHETVQLLHQFHSARPLELERAMQARFHHACSEGEWFRLSRKDVALFRLAPESVDAAHLLPEELRVTKEQVLQRRADLAAQKWTKNLETRARTGNTFPAHPGASSFMIRLPEPFRTQLRLLTARTRRTITAEVQLMLEKRLAEHGLWPPPASAQRRSDHA